MNVVETHVPSFPLALLGAGERAKVVSVRETPDRARDGRVEELGLRVGTSVQMLANGGGGPVLLKVDGTRLALGRRMALQIQVRSAR